MVILTLASAVALLVVHAASRTRTQQREPRSSAADLIREETFSV